MDKKTSFPWMTVFLVIGGVAALIGAFVSFASRSGTGGQGLGLLMVGAILLASAAR
jgi:hypothetical protein